MSRVCGECTHFLELDEKAGACRRFPPLADRQGRGGVWPLVMAYGDDWCGEYRFVGSGEVMRRRHAAKNWQPTGEFEVRMFEGIPSASDPLGQVPVPQKVERWEGNDGSSEWRICSRHALPPIESNG